MLTYKVAKKYSKGPEQLIAKFDVLNDAKEYIGKKIEQDVATRVVASYLLYDTGELMDTFDAGNSPTGSAASSGGGQQQSSSFRPNPLQTNPRPNGMPPSSFVNDDEKKK